jgi:excisionase family DNA binding protein
MHQNGQEVLTLEETAEYLRVTPAAVERSISASALPARQVDAQWRFLKAAVDDWLRGVSGKALLLSQAGALADDDTLDDIRAAIYAGRGRPETEK